MFPRLLVTLLLAFSALPPAAGERGVNVTGTGLARAEQTIAILQAAVAARDVKARPAVEEVRRLLERIARRMRASPQVASVAAGPVSVTSLRARPPWPGGQGAHIAAAQLTLTITDPAAVPRVTERLIAGGALSIESVAYMTPDPEGLARAALERAVFDARRKAEGMAAAAGVRLGPLLGLSGRQVRRLGPEDGARHLAGTVTILARVTATFAVGQ